jgi:hypothetical protein
MSRQESRAATRTPFVRLLLGRDQQLSFPLVDRAHCFGRVQDQVQDDLLQLNTIPLNWSQPLRQTGPDRNSILGDFASRQYNHLIDRFIEIKTMLSRRRFLDAISDPVDYVSRSIGIATTQPSASLTSPKSGSRCSKKFENTIR